LTVDLVVASPLSRAIDTADLAFPPHHTPNAQGNRECTETVREIMGLLLNGKRRPKSELALLYPHWGFSAVAHEEDVLWAAWGDAALEDAAATQERAHACLAWLWQREERDIALVGHGGIFALLTNGHGLVECGAGVGARFANCELRTCLLELAPDDDRPDDRPSIEAVFGGSRSGLAVKSPGELRFRLTLLEATT
jgi:broad specificity phosphatase PhoE